MARFTWEELPRVLLPESVERVFAELGSEGYAAYVVGGGPRNLLWGFPVEDWDIATNAPLDELTRLYGSNHPGLRFGTVRCGRHVEITAMRRDLGSIDGRHPAKVERVDDLEQDLTRRDFSVNAAAFNREGVYGSAQTRSDLRYRVWRTVGDPMARFAEDGLRLLRLARLWARYGGRIAGPTFDAAFRCRRFGLCVSRERRLAELLRLVACPHPAWAMVGHLGLGEALELRWRRFDPQGWPVPRDLRARLLYFLWGYSGDWSWVVDWLASWPLRRDWRRELTQAATRLDSRADPEAWAVQARVGRAGGGVLGRWALDAGYRGAVAPLALAVDGQWLLANFDLRPRELGDVIGTIRRWAAANPDGNTEAGIRQMLLERGVVPKL